MNENKMEFDDLIDMGAVRKNVKVGAHVITLKSLSYEVYSDLLAKAESDKTPMDSQVSVISAAIESIDGKSVPEDVKFRLLRSSQMGLMNLLSSEYDGIVKEQNALYEEVKKNTSQDSTKTA